MSDNRTPQHGGERPPVRPRENSARPAPNNDRTRVQPAPVTANGAPGPGGKGTKGRLLPGTVIARVILNCFKALLVVLCLGLVVGSIAAVQVIQYVVEATADDGNQLDLDEYQTSQTSYFYAYNPDNPNAREEGDYIEYQELIGAENRIWISLNEMPQDLINAVVATEDRKFYEHHGVNFERTIYALANELLGLTDAQFGASTITQQLVKNITKEDEVADADGDKSSGYLRKLREIFRAWGLHNRYSHDQIMEAYLNTIGLSERIAGIEAGAQKYFNKSAKDLTLAECATIAGITKAPTRYSPFQNPDRCLERRNDVVLFMLECEYITQAQAEEVWALEDLGLASREDVSQNESGLVTTGVFSYASDKAYNDVIADLMDRYGWSKSYATEQLYNRGYKVYLTVDLNVQAALDDILVDGYSEDPDNIGFFMDSNKFPGYKAALEIEEDVINDAGQVIATKLVMPQCAVAVTNYKGELIATGGGIGEKTGSLQFNRSIDGKRQNGSTMKPVSAYALGIDLGIITYSKGVLDAGVQARNVNNPSRDPETGAVINDWPKNAYRDGYRNTIIPVCSAVAESTNTVAARVGSMVGLDAMYEFLEDTLDVSSLVEADMGLGPLVLGSLTTGISPYELAGAFSIFGGDEEYGYGAHVTLHSYTKVEDAKGEIILEPEITPVQAIDPQSGYIMNRLLWNVLHAGTMPGGANPTARGMYPEGEMDSIGKTGTTSDDKDRWFVGLTPYYVTAVWWGYDMKHDLMRDGRGHGWSPSASTNIPVNVWKSLMETVQTNLEYKEFPAQPEGIQELRFCTSSGDLYQEGCPGSMLGYYSSFKTPEYCIGHDGEEAEPEG